MKRAVHASAWAIRAGLMLSTALVLGAVAVSPATAQDFNAVMAAPDDPDVNLAFARASVEAGDLNGAASALERVLIIDPNRHSARLLYAVVLYRLDDLQGAREQLVLLDPVNLTPLQRAEAQEYRRAVERRRSGMRFGGSLSAGVIYEEDAAGALTTEFDSLFFGPPPEEHGTSSVISARLNASHDLGSQGMSVFGSLGAYDKSTFDGADGDLRRGDVELGFAQQNRLSRWSISAVARGYELLGEPYLVEIGARGRASWRLDSATTFTLSGEAVEQSFDEPFVDAVSGFLGGDRDGWRYDISAGFSRRLTARSSAGFSIGYVDKEASYEPFGYSGGRVQANLEARTRRGTYLAASAGALFIEYDAPDPFFIGFGAPVREDVRTWGRVAVGTPISAFSPAGATGDWRQKVTLEGALTYGGRDSEEPLADHDSLGAEARLIWRFGARD